MFNFKNTTMYQMISHFDFLVGTLLGKALEKRVPFSEERGRNEMQIFEERKKERIRSFSRSILKEI